ncbi:MAG: dTDP-4-dehydrorhamnose 3,5-epimerase family protein [Thermoleophilaceae bacterium]|nr:dTDP-4-dehydrorhamnose 3,5-epimerase family protein [Thermoleophilaceae bacterium]
MNLNDQASTAGLITGAGMNSVGIADVQLRDLTVHGDERGRVFEAWRSEWVDWPVKQLTEARAQAGVMKGLHLHYRQWDWWRCIRGRMLVGLYDARPSSPTYGVAANFELNPDTPQALAIPPGVAHGFYVLEDLEMIYLLSEAYNPDDEFGIHYKSVGIEWPNPTPILSQRDIDLPTREAFQWAGA